jgi:cellulose synthase operon protein C
MNSLERRDMDARGLLVLLVVGLVAGCGSSDPARVVADADAKIAAGEFAEANVALKKLVQSAPQNVGARARLAAIAVANGDFQAADAELARLDRAAITDATSQRIRFEVDLGLGRYKEVAAALAGTVAIEPAGRALLLGHAERGQGNYAGAQASYEEAARLRPDWADPAIALADLAVARQDVAGAVKLVEAALARNAKDADALVARGKLYGRQGDFANAAASFAKAGVNAPSGWAPSKRWSAKYQEAEAHLRRNDIVAAKRVYEEMQKAVPGIAATRMLAARIALLEKRYADGIDELQRLSQATSGNDGVDLLLAQAQFAGGAREQGITTLERVVARSPDNSDAIKLLSRVRLEQSRPDRALELLGSLPDAQTTDPDVVAIVSAARLQQGEPGRAAAALERAVIANPTNQSAKLQLAAARLAQGDNRAALALLDELPKDVLVTQQARLRLLALIAEGKREEVSAVIESLLTREPPDIDGLTASIDVLRAAGRQDLARRVAVRLEKLGGEQPQVLLRIASVAAADQDWTKADEVLQKAVLVDPKSVDARVALAQVAAARGDEARALAVLDEAIRVDATAVAPSLLRAGAHLREGDAAAALGVLDALIKAAPKDGVAAAAAASLLANAGQGAAALARFEIAVDQRPSAENLYGLAQTQLAAKQNDAARASLQRAVAARPEWPAAVGALATLDVAAGKKDEAVRRAADFARRYPNNPQALGVHGEVLLGAGRAAEASAVFDKAFALAPSSALAVAQHRARVASGQPRPDTPLVEWLTRSPSDLAVRALLAEWYIRSNNRARSIAEYEELVRRSESNVLALNNLAWLYTDSNPARAEELGRRAVALAPDATAVLDTLGWILFKRDKTNEALQLLEKAAAGSPDDPSIRYHYAAALAKSGATEKASAMVERALQSKLPFDARGDAERLARQLAR